MKIGSISDDQLCQIFINGLSLAAKSYVALQQPDSLAKALELARLYESIDDLKQASANKELLKNMTAAAATPFIPSEIKEMREIRDQMSEWRNEMNALRRENNQRQSATCQDDNTLGSRKLEINIRIRNRGTITGQKMSKVLVNRMQGIR